MMAAGGREVIGLAADSASVARARHALRDLLPAWGLAHLLDDAELVASELVTNAIVHAGTDVTLVLEERRPAGLRIEVIDRLQARRATPALKFVEPGQETLASERTTGRGLDIVAAVTRSWGVEDREHDKVVWADLGDVGPAPAPSAPSAASETTEHEERRIPIRLVATPVRLLVESANHVEDLLRELSYDLTRGRDALLEELVSLAPSVAPPPQDVLREAVRQGVRLLDDDFFVTTSTPARLRRTFELLEHAASLSASGKLLTLPPSEEVRAFRRWCVEEIARQVAGSPPTPCPFPVVTVRDTPHGSSAPQDPIARLTLLQQVITDLTACDALGDVGDVLVRAAMTETGGTSGSVCLLADDGVTVELVGAVSYDEDVAGHWGSFALSDDVPASDAIRIGSPVYLRNTAERDERYPVFTRTPVVGDEAVAVVPMALAPQRPIGALVVGYAAPNEFVGADRSFLDTLAAVGAQAVERLRLLRLNRETQDRLELLAHSADELAQSRTPEEAARTLARLVVPGLADMASVHLLREGRVELAAAAATSAQDERRARELYERWPDGEGARSAAGVAIATGEASRFNVMSQPILEQASSDPERLDLLISLDISSGMVLPMRTAGGAVGALVLANQGGRPISEEEWNLAQDIAARAAIAVGRAQLFAERSRAAASLQASLLPAGLPEPAGYEIAAVYRPAARSADLGGDFYDVLTVGDSHLAVIGDARGHGVDAAAIAAIVRHSIRALARVCSGPTELATRLNELLLDQQGEEPQLCTLLLVELDDEGNVVAHSAGHPRPAILTPVGAVSHLELGGDILGWFDEVALGSASAHLSPGDALVLYTDGVIERREQGVFFGEEGVIATLRALAGSDALTLATAVADASAERFGDLPKDDMAVLVLRRR